MEFGSDVFLQQVREISDYIQSSFKPELTLVGEFSKDTQESFHEYSAPIYLYALSFVEPTKLSISIDMLDVTEIPKGKNLVWMERAAKKGDELSATIGTSVTGKSSTEVGEYDNVNYFVLKQKPYRRLEFSTVDLKKKLLESYKNKANRAEAMTPSWIGIIVVLLIVIVVVAVVAAIIGAIISYKKSGSVFTENHITTITKEAAPVKKSEVTYI
jgi:uncharacterized protein YxeA